MTRSRQLVLEHLEGVSRRVMEEYPDLIRELIRRRAGVYALYKRDKLHYVGLASNLMGRLNAHLRDRHHRSWDRFAVYLTVRDDHTKELESLVLRIVAPPGNKQTGRFARSQNLLSSLYARMKEADADRRAVLLGGFVGLQRRRAKARRSKGASALAGLSDRSIQLRGIRGGWEFLARLRTDGTIRYNGKIYDSPSAAGRAAVRGPCNGWTFWRYKAKRNWRPLKSLRR